MRFILAVVFIMSSISAYGFSPYENYLSSGKQTHAALFAAAKEGKTKELTAALNGLNNKKSLKALKKVEITNVSFYSKKLHDKTWFLVYFDYDGKDYLKAVNAFESTKAVQAIKPLVSPHPRAATYGTTWLQLEWICYIKASQKKGEAASKFAMTTRIKPKKEQEYRMLHQGIWPGVRDQMARGNYRNFSIFFVELDKELFEFFYVEYVGTDSKKDGELNKADPCNQRWWKLTDPCQKPLPGTDGIWSMMDKLQINDNTNEE
jgi:L-rhamnose mutarotase